ncbi:hypothetical protein LTR81_018420 [Elasticomyces elasticus]
MAEVAGLVLGALPLFNVVVEDINYIQIGRDFTGRLETTNVRLSNARLQLLRWGETVHEVEQRMDETTRKESITNANGTLKCLHTLLEQGRQKVNHYGGADGGVPLEKAIPSTVDQGQDAAKCCEELHPAPAIKTVFNKDIFRRRSSTDTKTHDHGASVRDKARITSLFSDLERSFPAAQTIRLKLAANEVEQLKTEIADKICEYLDMKDEAMTKVLNDLRNAPTKEPSREQVTNTTNHFNGTNNGGSQFGNMSINGDFTFSSGWRG